MAIWYWISGDGNSAQLYWSRALEWEETRFSAQCNLLALEVARRQWDLALPAAEALLKESPEDVSLLFSLGTIKAGRGEWSAACAVLESAYRQDPLNRDIRSRLIASCLKSRNIAALYRTYNGLFRATWKAIRTTKAKAAK